MGFWGLLFIVGRLTSGREGSGGVWQELAEV